MSGISVVIIAFNSAATIAKSVASARFADEVVVVDSGSEDSTVAICEKAGARVVHQPWLGFGRQKQKAVDLAANEWVFVLDSDEMITPQLQEEIALTLKNPTHDAYFVARLNSFFGQPMHHGGLYPDYTLRLFRRPLCHFSEDAVHEKVVCSGTVGHLKAHMLHDAYESIEQFIVKQNRYSTLGAKPNRIKALFNPLWTFIKLYIIKGGFLDGWNGFITARLYSQYTFWKYIKERESHE